MNIRLELPPVRSVWGFGERYDITDHIGVEIVNRVEEKFTHQGEKTYLPLPIAVSSEFAVRVDTDSVFTFTFLNEGGHTVMELSGDKLSDDDVKTAYGKPRDTVAQLIGEVCSVPDWVFAPWASANRWTSDEDVMKFLDDAERYGFSFSTLVLEAWSDEATFYNSGIRPRCAGVLRRKESISFCGSARFSRLRKDFTMTSLRKTYVTQRRTIFL